MKPAYALIVIAYCAGIFWLSSQPVPPVPAIKFPGQDKLEHMVLYGGLAFVTAFGMRRSNPEVSARILFWGPVLFASAYGVSDEVHQAFVPPRSFDPLDIAANAAGAFVVMLLLRRHAWRGAFGKAPG